MKIDGGCHCGYITYEAEADPQRPFICHCTDCQELSGSAFQIAIRVASDDFRQRSCLLSKGLLPCRSHGRRGRTLDPILPSLMVG